MSYIFGKKPPAAGVAYGIVQLQYYQRSLSFRLERSVLMMFTGKGEHAFSMNFYCFIMNLFVSVHVFGCFWQFLQNNVFSTGLHFCRLSKAWLGNQLQYPVCPREQYLLLFLFILWVVKIKNLNTQGFHPEGSVKSYKLVYITNQIMNPVKQVLTPESARK